MKRVGTVAVSVIAVLLIAQVLTRSASGRAGDRGPSEAPPAPVAPPAPEAPPAPGGPAPAGVLRGNAGVGFAGPHQEMQVAVLKRMLGATDDEWKRLGPNLQKLLDAKRNLSTGAGMNWTTSNNKPAEFKASTARPDSAPGKAMQLVRDALADETIADAELARRMSAVREARKAARTAYEAAEKELLGALTPRQQALLMTLGVVE